MDAARPEDAWRVAALTMMRAEDLRKALSGPPDTSIVWVRAAASLGLPQAQVRLARMLLQGEGAAHDEAAAFHLFACAARAGDADAHNMLGRCHEHGWGTLPDAARAAYHYRHAAEQGVSWAQYNLGHLLLDGNGVTKDRAEAFLWYLRAAQSGHERAMNLVARCYEKGWGVARDFLAARDWYRRSAQSGYFRGAYNHATILAAKGCILGAMFWFRRGLDHATEPTRANMLHALARHPDPRLRTLAHLPRLRNSASAPI